MSSSNAMMRAIKDCDSKLLDEQDVPYSIATDMIMNQMNYPRYPHKTTVKVANVNTTQYVY